MDYSYISVCILKRAIQWIAILTTLLVFPSFLGCVFSCSLAVTCMLLVMSYSIVNFFNQKPVMLEEAKKDVIFSQTCTQQHGTEEMDKLTEEEEAISTQQQTNLAQSVQESQPVEQKLKWDAKTQEIGVTHDQFLKHFHSESESIEHSCLSSSEDSDMDWLHLGNFGQSPECSDDSNISDEESLIEIALPTGHFVCPREDTSKYFMQQKLQEMPKETIFYQPSLLELFAENNEMNDEENLIEIDLSMGSIKCSRFEIHA